ncbi:GNAT family N-acetyltransferase [Sutcliffiella horikoshii]|uniref:GNAT family N-acetyltransferase n=1 Tax=Sutcliffiella horikoshii TaxID=79883 RepID=A0AA95B5V5_9BACI|nr:GNAT family N-acetyltransferase [Sutcliffiella horikoshii]TYS55919.1 GNAT family N-acetyltransferase [Sutcliffiella horikoshii]
MRIRNIQDKDFLRISTNLNTWWGGRDMIDMLPRLFILHFKDTSYIIEDNEETIGFVIGFVSPSNPKQAYIHFVGVNPKARLKNIGRTLYEHFFRAVKEKGCTEVGCVTSPVNATSINFHTKMGFTMKDGDMVIDGIPIHQNYDGIGQDRVIFVKSLEARSDTHLKN